MNMARSLRFTLFTFILTSVLACDQGISEIENNQVPRGLSSDPKDVKFYAFSKTTDKNGILVEPGNEVALLGAGFQKGRKLVIHIHGFEGSYRSIEPTAVLKAYLQSRSDYVNIILVDYSKLDQVGNIPVLFALFNYLPTLRNIPVVGSAIENFIEFMIQQGYVDSPASVHLLGNSLGAHIAASAGNQVAKKLGQKVGRITGLDPAGPFMDMLNRSNRLGPNSAVFVEAVHSSADFLGTYRSMAQIDFFANGGAGFAQKNCLFSRVFIFCAHLKAVEYYARSIRGEKKYGCPCLKSSAETSLPCPKPKLQCDQPALFGEFGNTNMRGNYYLKI